MLKTISNSAQRTERIGRKFSTILNSGDIICLVGELGAGKTCFAKGIIRGLRTKNKYIGSPTFTFINEYQGKLPIYHFDLYRIRNEIEIDDLGWEEYFYSQGIVIVEWAEKMKKFLPSERLDIHFSYSSKNSRKLIFKMKGKKWMDRLSRLKKILEVK